MNFRANSESPLKWTGRLIFSPLQWTSAISLGFEPQAGWYQNQNCDRQMLRPYNYAPRSCYHNRNPVSPRNRVSRPWLRPYNHAPRSISLPKQKPGFSKKPGF
ncbi:hypothetical protein LAY57_21980 [Argonema antarcticum A004/B2]|nr:hypothetical protein [Argonema antarcticum A004/B2]